LNESLAAVCLGKCHVPNKSRSKSQSTDLKHNILLLRRQRGFINGFRLHKETAPPLEKLDHRAPSIPNKTPSTTSRKPADCTVFSARLLHPRSGREYGHNASTRPEDADLKTLNSRIAFLLEALARKKFEH
jgi:hypothetical protein